MNILFVYYVPSGGVETLNRQRASALKEKNIHCHFLYYRKERELVNNHHAPTFITNDDKEIQQILENGNYSAVIITSDYKSLPRFRDLGYTGKLILEIQGYGPQSVARSELQNAIPYVTSYSDGLLSSKTPHIIQIFHDLYPSFPTFIIENCFDTNQFSYRSLPKDAHPIIAWIGRLEDNKNWREFLHIGCQLIYEYNSNIKLYMFEDHTLSLPEERQEFQQLVKTLNLEKNLTIHSNIPNPEMQEYFSLIGDSGGFLCSTSKVEGFGYAIIEAMSCRCPVLSTDSDGVRGSIIHNQTGKYYTLGNIDEAVKEAKELMTSSRLKEHIRSTALEHIKLHFSPEQYTDHFIRMITDLRMK
ncbi:glycosyltransferase family 4 protein [Priestia megaterium]|uniref:glycosyltransferase family 4 protein n=1 Tax=Priestia megaterium TaxID=1404 RepID=UPI00203AFF4B|nr:glycosyltransferase family 4 protein [Priestia megaterium]MCM3197153.1 glycosyltransferase family 4 protein [Priestia megaterium]